MKEGQRGKLTRQVTSDLGSRAQVKELQLMKNKGTIREEGKRGTVMKTGS